MLAQPLYKRPGERLALVPLRAKHKFLRRPGSAIDTWDGLCLCHTCFEAQWPVLVLHNFRRRSLRTDTSLEWMAVRAHMSLENRREQQRCRADSLCRMSPPEKDKLFAGLIVCGFYTRVKLATLLHKKPRSGTSPQKNLSKKDVRGSGRAESPAHSRACRRPQWLNVFVSPREPK